MDLGIILFLSFVLICFSIITTLSFISKRKMRQLFSTDENIDFSRRYADFLLNAETAAVDAIINDMNEN